VMVSADVVGRDGKVAHVEAWLRICVEILVLEDWR
jgi:hypothetical protein